MLRSIAILALVVVAAHGAAAAQPAEDAEAFAAHAARYEARLLEDPEDFESRLRAAQSLNAVMAIRTHGNLPLVDGLQDTAENRALWGDLGKRALAHARVAQRLRPDSVEAAAVLAASYMFYSSSLGILSAILKGTGSEFQENARRLVALDESYEDALGHKLLAGFYMIAPWPIRDMDRSRAAYERAAELAPASASNQYGLGVFWARDGEPAKAGKHFERALAMPCSVHSERFFCDWMKQETRRALATLEN